MKVYYSKGSQPQQWNIMNYDQFTQRVSKEFQLPKGNFDIKVKNGHQTIKNTKDLHIHATQAGVVIEPHQQSLPIVLSGVQLPESRTPLQSHRIGKQKIAQYTESVKTDHDEVGSFKRILSSNKSNLSADWKQIIMRIKDLQAESHYFKNHMQENYATFQSEINALIDEANQVQQQQQQVFEHNSELLLKIEQTRREISEQQMQYDILKSQFNQQHIENFIQSKQLQNRNQIKIFKYIDEFDEFLNENKFILAYGEGLEIRKKLQNFKNKFLQLSK